MPRMIRPRYSSYLPLALAALVAGPACKDQAKESATLAAGDVQAMAELVDKDIGEVERGLPQGATQLASLLADGADPRQDIAGVRKGLMRVRRDVPDLLVAKSTFFALADATGIAIRNDLEEDVMAGKNLLAGFPVLAKAKDGYVAGTGSFGGPPARGGPDEDWIAAAPVKRADGSVGALLVTGWSYRYFSRHLQEALKTRLLEVSKAAGTEGKLPVYYVAVFDKTGVYAAPTTPDVDSQTLGAQDLVGKTASGPVTGTLSITDRAFGFAATRTARLAPDTGIVVLRSEP
jgi:hypothetical protein